MSKVKKGLSEAKKGLADSALFEPTKIGKPVRLTCSFKDFNNMIVIFHDPVKKNRYEKFVCEKLVPVLTHIDAPYVGTYTFTGVNACKFEKIDSLPDDLDKYELYTPGTFNEDHMKIYVPKLV